MKAKPLTKVKKIKKPKKFLRKNVFLTKEFQNTTIIKNKKLNQNLKGGITKKTNKVQGKSLLFLMNLKLKRSQQKITATLKWVWMEPKL